MRGLTMSFVEACRDQFSGPIGGDSDRRKGQFVSRFPVLSNSHTGSADAAELATMPAR